VPQHSWEWKTVNAVGQKEAARPCKGKAPCQPDQADDVGKASSTATLSPGTQLCRKFLK
jgi:hypothetical protein